MKGKITMETPLMDKYYDYVLKKKRPEDFLPEERIAFEILRDATDRRGWRQEWDQFDDDIREELIGTWIEKIKAAM